MITAHPDAPEGSVLSLKDYEPSDFAPSSAILCRNTAPLISFAFSLLRRDVGCRVLGREIGQGLIALIKKLNAESIDILEGRLATYLEREVRKFESKGELASADAVRDRVECISVFLNALPENNRTVPSLCAKITSLFDDNAKGILTLSTVHKSKGLEWPTVFILDFDLYMPSKYAKKPWQVIQEHNLIYVAVTRAKLDLRYIKSGAWKIKAPASGLRPTLNQQLTDKD